MLIKLSRYVINTDYIIYSEDDAELSTVVIHMWFPSEGVRDVTIIDDDRLKYLAGGEIEITSVDLRKRPGVPSKHWQTIL